jgi:hypothetical protein
MHGIAKKNARRKITLFVVSLGMIGPGKQPEQQ